MADGVLGQEREVGPFKDVLGMGTWTRMVGVFPYWISYDMMVFIRFCFLRT